MTGTGLDLLWSTVDRVLGDLPVGDAPVRLWVDRSFHLRGAGTVVTGTLVSGTVSAGRDLWCPRLDRTVAVREVRSLGQRVEAATAPARVALNLRSVDRHTLERGDALVTADRWRAVSLVDVRFRDGERSLPREVLVHVGTAAVAAKARALGPQAARLRLARPLPLHVGDRVAVRLPGTREIVAAAVVDPAPPEFASRQDVRRRVREMTFLRPVPDAAAELRRRGPVTGAFLHRIGVTPAGAPVTGDWYVDETHAARFRALIADVVGGADPLRPGPTLAEVRQAVGLPDVALVTALAPPDLRTVAGRLCPPEPAALPAPVLAALREVTTRFAAAPFTGLTPAALRDAGLTPGAAVALARRGHLSQHDGLYFSHDAAGRALAVLRTLPQPFTVSDARKALGTNRPSTVALLSHLDTGGATERRPDGTRLAR